MAKTANLYARIEPEIKYKAEEILSRLGLPVSNAITLFYNQIILQNGLPFEVKLPKGSPLFLDDLSVEELDRELEKGVADMENGRVVPADKVFADMKRKYDL